MKKYEQNETIVLNANRAMHKACTFLPDDKKEALFAILAFSYEAQRAVEENKDVKRIEDLEKKINHIFDGKEPEEPLLKALYETIDTFGGDKKPYLDYLEEMRADYNKQKIETEEDLEAHAYRTCGTMIIMMLPVTASKNYKEEKQKLTGAAYELGLAIGITTVLRNVRDDLTRHRILFPQEILTQHQVKIETLRTGVVTAEYRSLVEGYIDKAKEKYEIFYDNLSLFDENAVTTMFMIAKFSQGILDEIRKNDYNNITTRHRLGKIRQYFMTKKIQKELKNRGIKD